MKKTTIICLLLFTTTFFSSIIGHSLIRVSNDINVIENDSNLIYIEQLHDSIVCEIDKYIHKIAPSSRLSADSLFDMCERYNIDVKFALAQGQIESHYGTRGIASETNSVFNVNSCDGLSSQEIIKRGHGYDHPNESIEPYLALLENYYIVESEQELLDNFVSIKGKRYASDKNYERKMKNTYNKIGRVTNIDALIEEYRTYKNRI